MGINTYKELAPGHVHIWLAPDGAHLSPDFSDRRRGLLSLEEKARAGRFISLEKKNEFLHAHAFLRTVLSGYSRIHPREWVFETNPHGKPEIIPAMNPGKLRFNLAHTRGLAALAVTRKADVGLDVENLDREVNMGVIHRFFARPEQDYLASLPFAEQKEKFLILWTLKEAWVKARGQGLSLGLDTFWFDLEQPGPLSVHLSGEGEETAGNWQFHQAFPLPGFVLALAVRRETNRQAQIHFCQYPPPEDALGEVKPA